MKSLEQLNLKEKKYIIFDLDGTLIDSLHAWDLFDQMFIRKLGDVEVALPIVIQDRKNFMSHCTSRKPYQEYAKYLAKRYHFSKSEEEVLQIRQKLAKQFFETEVDFKKGAVSLIYCLKELGYTLVIATMSTRMSVDIYSKINKKMLEKMNIDDTFDYIITNHEVEQKKPNPEIYLKIVDHFHAKKEECLIFEDSLNGIIAAKRAGIEVVNVVEKNYEDVQKEINKVTDYQIQNFEEFYTYLEKND